MGYRENWFKTNPGITLPGRTGNWYQCVRCKDYFRKSDIDIDHRIPKRDGGTDDLWNLQPMCKHCNRSKCDNQTNVETASTIFMAAANGDLGKALGSIAKRKTMDALGVKYRRK